MPSACPKAVSSPRISLHRVGKPRLTLGPHLRKGPGGEWESLSARQASYGDVTGGAPGTNHAWSIGASAFLANSETTTGLYTVVTALRRQTDQRPQVVGNPARDRYDAVRLGTTSAGAMGR